MAGDLIFERLHQAKAAGNIAADMQGRSPFFSIGIVTRTDDPTNKRRVKVTLQSKGGRTETDWLNRLVASPFDDPPIPRIGQTVGVLFIDGNPHRGVYFGALTNATNVERDLGDPVKDDGRTIEGDQTEAIEKSRTTTVKQDDLLTVNGTLTINADGSITIAGATVQITASTINLN